MKLFVTINRNLTHLYVLEEILEVNTRYQWDDPTRFQIRHSQYKQNQAPKYQFNLIVTPNGTTKAQYNDPKSYHDASTYAEIFTIHISTTKKRSLKYWLEGVDCPPDKVFFQGENDSGFTHPRAYTDEQEIHSVKFMCIEHAWPFICQNQDRIRHNTPMYVICNLEWVLASCGQMRKNLERNHYLALPEMETFNLMIQKSKAKFPNGAVPFTDVIAPVRNTYDMECDDLLRQHQTSFNNENGESSVTFGVPYDYTFHYVDVSKSVQQQCNPYKKSMQGFGPTSCQNIKIDQVSNDNGWIRDGFEGNFIKFTKKGQVWKIKNDDKIMIHSCNDGCRKQGPECGRYESADFRFLPSLAAAYYASHKSTDVDFHSLSDEKAEAHLRNWHYKIKLNVMKLPNLTRGASVKDGTGNNVRSNVTIADALNGIANMPVQHVRVENSEDTVELKSRLAALEAQLIRNTKTQTSLQNELNKTKKENAALVETAVTTATKKFQSELQAVDEKHDQKHVETDDKMGQVETSLKKQIVATAKASFKECQKIGSIWKKVKNEVSQADLRDRLRASMYENPTIAKRLMRKNPDLKRKIGIIGGSQLENAATVFTKNEEIMKSNEDLDATYDCKSFKKAIGNAVDGVNTNAAIEPMQVLETVEPNENEDELQGTRLARVKTNMRSLLEHVIQNEDDVNALMDSENESEGDNDEKDEEKDTTISEISTQDSMKEKGLTISKFISNISSTKVSPIQNKIKGKRNRSESESELETNESISKMMKQKLSVNANQSALSLNPNDGEQSEMETDDVESGRKNNKNGQGQELINEFENSAAEVPDALLEELNGGNINVNLDDIGVIETERGVPNHGARMVGQTGVYEPNTFFDQTDKIDPTIQIVVRHQPDPNQPVDPLSMDLPDIKSGDWNTQWKNCGIIKAAKLSFNYTNPDRWNARLITFLCINDFEAFLDGFARTYDNNKDKENLINKALYSEVDGLKSNIAMARRKQLPSMMIQNMLDTKYDNDKVAWKFIQRYAHMPISINMMQNYFTSLKKQLIKQKLSPAQILEWHIPNRRQTPDINLGPECIPTFRSANLDACGQFKRFIRQWLGPEHTEIETPKAMSQLKIKQFTQMVPPVPQSSMLAPIPPVQIPQVQIQSSNSQPSSSTTPPVVVPNASQSQPNPSQATENQVNPNQTESNSMEDALLLEPGTSKVDKTNLVRNSNPALSKNEIKNLSKLSPTVLSPTFPANVQIPKTAQNIVYTPSVSPKCYRSQLSPMAAPFIPQPSFQERMRMMSDPVTNENDEIEMEIDYDNFLVEQNMSPKTNFNPKMTSNESPNISMSHKNQPQKNDSNFLPTSWTTTNSVSVNKNPIHVDGLTINDTPCPYGDHCIADYADHWLQYSHPGDPTYQNVPKPECDLHNQCPFQHDSFHTDRYSHTDTPAVSHPSRSTEYDPIPDDEERRFYFKNRDQRIIAERYARANLFYPKVNIDDEFMLQDKKDKNPYNQKLRDQITENTDIFNPLLPVDESILPRKFETDRLFKLRIAAQKEMREAKAARQYMSQAMPLYNTNDPLERHRFRLQQKENERKRKRLANAENFKNKRKDFEGLRILYVNLNDPEIQLPRVFAIYSHIDIFVFTELNIDRDLLLRRTLTPAQYSVFTHKGVPTVVNGVKQQKVFSAIFINESQGLSATVKYDKVPFISIYVSVPTKTVPFKFNITSFYRFHCGPKSHSLRLFTNQAIFDYFSDRFREICKIQYKVPSMIVGDGNVDLFSPRDQDNKRYCQDIREQVTSYFNELKNTTTNSANRSVKESCIDWWLSKGINMDHLTVHSGRDMIHNDGHKILIGEYNISTVKQKLIKKIKVKIYPDKDIVFNAAIEVFKQREEELERKFERENILRHTACTDPNWEKPEWVGDYSATVTQILNDLGNKLVLEIEKEIDLSRNRCILSPSTIEYQKQVNNAAHIVSKNPYAGNATLYWQKQLSAWFNRLFQRDYRRSQVLLHSDYDCLKENDIFHLHRRLNSGMQLKKLKAINFGPDVLAKHFRDLQAADIIPYEEEKYAWREMTKPFDMKDCQLSISGTDRSNSIVHNISNLKENTTSHNTNICRKLLAGLPRSIVGFHLVRMVRLDTELGHYNPINSTNKLIKLPKAKKDPNTLEGYRCLQIPQFPAQLTEGIWIQNFSKSITKSSGAISSCQHGFRRNHGCPTALAHLFENINHNFSPETFLLFVDFKNAFGTVRHNFLLQQLKKLLSHGLHRLVKDQLTNRYVVAYEDGSQSEPILIPDIGVPQGSNGGPIYFTLYAELIIDIVKKYQKLLQIWFADDLILQLMVKDREQGYKLVKELMMDFTKETSKIGISVAPHKSQYMIVGELNKMQNITYTVDNIEYTIKHKVHITHLGFQFDATFDFRTHYQILNEKIRSYRPLVLNVLKAGNRKEASHLARSLGFGVLQYGFDVLPLGNSSDYSMLNRALLDMAKDILNIPRQGDHHTVSQNLIFHEMGWTETSNVHKIAIFALLHRALTQNEPEFLAKRLRKILVYESDSKPFIWGIDTEESEQLIHKCRIIRRDYAILKPNIEVPYPNLFPYNACRMLVDLPESIRAQLGHDDFLCMVKRYYKGLCQHAVSHTDKTCPSCVKMNRFLSEPRPFAPPVFNYHHPAYKDGTYYKFTQNSKADWSSITNSWGIVQKRELAEIKQKLQRMKKCNFAKIKSGFETYLE